MKERFGFVLGKTTAVYYKYYGKKRVRKVYFKVSLKKERLGKQKRVSEKSYSRTIRSIRGARTKHINKVNKKLKKIRKEKKVEGKTKFVWVIAHYVSGTERTSSDIAISIEVPSDANIWNIYTQAEEEINLESHQTLEFTDVIEGLNSGVKLNYEPSSNGLKRIASSRNKKGL